mmetsp:Transcript_32863/g.29160  ORF Transcript_32863/g.29160 Transcript_32863/m.29160 type:complete len:112 (-) Transcript_32863:4-339(-)
MVDRMYNRAIKKKDKFEKLEKDKQEIKEKELKTYFKPKILNSVESWENLKKNEDKINRRIRKKEDIKLKKNSQAVKDQDKRFEKTNKSTVFSRMQNDLNTRRDRDRKRRRI